MERQLKAYLEIGFTHIHSLTHVYTYAPLPPPPPYYVYKIVRKHGVKVLRKSVSLHS